MGSHESSQILEVQCGHWRATVTTLAAPQVASAQAKTFSWKMTNAYGPGAPFHVQGPGSPTDFIKMVDAMSQGRLKIQHFAAGELIPALEGFDAVSKGTVEVNCANAYFWAGKTFAAHTSPPCRSASTRSTPNSAWT